MKANPRFYSRLVFIAAGCFLFLNNSFAQKNGVLPLTGMKFFNEGIAAGSIDIKIDGD